MLRTSDAIEITRLQIMLLPFRSFGNFVHPVLAVTVHSAVNKYMATLVDM